MLLQRRMRVPFEEILVIENMRGIGKTGIEVAECQVNLFVNVTSATRIGMNLLPVTVDIEQSGVDRHHRRQHFVADVDERSGLLRGEFVFGDDARDRLADVPHFIDCEDRLILRRWKNAVPYREIAPDCDRDDAGNAKRPFVVDGENARVCVRAPQQFPEEHPR